MPTLSHSLLAAGLLAMSGSAFAQPPSPPAPGGPAKHQPAKRADLQAMLEARFDKLDANKDGKLTPEDHAARRTERRELAFSRLDADKNGAISKAEFTAPRAKPQDGPQMHRAAMNWRGHMPRGPWGARPGPDGAGAKAGQPVTKSDFVAQGLARFDKVDTDRDGILSQAERDAARSAMRERRGGPGRMPQSPPPAPKGK